jgi:linoleoyl-CoA desaturase
MNVMHDGNHGSYSTKGWVNKSWEEQSMYSSWKRILVQNNVTPTYTNIPGHDED